jgi:hypothetical protein
VGPLKALGIHKRGLKGLQAENLCFLLIFALKPCEKNFYMKDSVWTLLHLCHEGLSCELEEMKAEKMPLNLITLV